MRIKAPDYTFSKTELQILRELTKNKQSLSAIKTTLAIKPALLTYNLKKLQQQGLIQTTKQGNQKTIHFSETKHATLLRDLFVTYDYMDWENILCGKTLQILLQTQTSKGDLSVFSNATLWRNITGLKARGIITQTQKQYQINPRFNKLIDFLNEYQTYCVNKLAASLSENAAILWRRNMEFIVRAPQTAKASSPDFHKTATSLFPQFGLPLFTDSDIYVYSQNKNAIRIEDVILHTLLIDADSARYVTYALLLLKKTEKQVDRVYLMQEAQALGLKDRVVSMFAFLETHMHQPGDLLPGWDEFVMKANDYAVVV